MEKIDNFIKLFKNFKQEQQKQKRRGLNDFNLFTTLLKQDNEVRLHSRFLKVLLDPNGEHCQGELFLELFLKECKLTNSLDIKNTSVFAEYEGIDLYLTDDNTHIIIENKILARDQQGQIKKYIEKIKEENKDKDLTGNLIVLYLSLDREKPSDCSLYDSQTEKQNGFCAEDGYLTAVNNGVKTEEKYKFQSIHYNDQIKKWLAESLRQVANLTNLSLAILQYQEVIDRLYNTYKEKIVSLREYLDTKENRLETIQTMQEIVKEYPAFRREEIKLFLKSLVEKLTEKIEKEPTNENPKWEVVTGEDFLNGKKYNTPLIIRQSNNAKILFSF